MRYENRVRKRIEKEMKGTIFLRKFNVKNLVVSNFLLEREREERERECSLSPLRSSSLRCYSAHCYRHTSASEWVTECRISSGFSLHNLNQQQIPSRDFFSEERRSLCYFGRKNSEFCLGQWVRLTLFPFSCSVKEMCFAA